MANLHHIKFSHLIVLVPDAYTLRRRQSESALWPNQMEIVCASAFRASIKITPSRILTLHCLFPV